MRSLRMSLDERYLLFCERTAGVFREFPELEAIRLLLFRGILLGRPTPGLIDHLKHWLRPILKRGRAPAKRLEQADVVVWFEETREVVIDQLKPVVKELRLRGVPVLAVGYRSDRSKMDFDLILESSFTARSPEWARMAWDGLVAAEPELATKGRYQAYLHAVGVSQGLFDGISKLLDRVQPRVVLMAASNLPGGAALAVKSRKRGIRSSLIQHGITQAFYTPTITDEMIVWGDVSLDSMVALGTSIDRLRVLGSPRHDLMEFAEENHVRARKVLSERLGLARIPTFTFFSNGNDLVRNGSAPAEAAQWLECLAVRLTGGINVVVRLHPNEDGTLYRNCGHVTLTKDEVGLDVALGGSDWIGSLCSTALYEALLYRKPVWHFDSDEWPELAKNWREGLAVRVASKDDLLDLAERSLGGSNGFGVTQEMIHRVFANHPNATQKVADYVEEMVSRV